MSLELTNSEAIEVVRRLSWSGFRHFSMSVCLMDDEKREKNQTKDKKCEATYIIQTSDWKRDRYSLLDREPRPTAC